MERIQVVEGALLNDAGIDEVSLVRCNSEVLENEAVCMLSVLLDHYYIFDSNSEFTIVVVSWLIRDAHSFNKFSFSCS